MKTKHKKMSIIFVAIELILTVFLFAVTVITASEWFESSLITIFTTTCIALYGFVFYRQPHGNMLKYTMLIYALGTVVTSCFILARYDGVIVSECWKPIAALGICYAAGRLDKAKENQIVFAVSGLCLVISLVMNLVIYKEKVDFLSGCRLAESLILFLTLSIAYCVRYYEHKEAGLRDRFYQ